MPAQGLRMSMQTYLLVEEMIQIQLVHFYQVSDKSIFLRHHDQHFWYIAHRYVDMNIGEVPSDLNVPTLALTDLELILQKLISVS